MPRMNDIMRAKQVLQARLIPLLLLLCLSLVACPPPQPLPQKNQDVWVSVEGPWAFADDTDKSKMVLIAPSNTGHSGPFVQHALGEQDLATPSEITILNKVDGPKTCSGEDCANTYDAEVKRGTIDRITHPDKNPPYVVRLPRPDDYWGGVAANSRIGTSWTEDPSERDKSWDQRPYTTKIWLHYTVSKLEGFKIGDAQYSFQGPHHNELVVEMTPIGKGDKKCDMPSRAAFKALVGLFGLELYADFQDESTSGSYSPDCWKCDPQSPKHPTCRKNEHDGSGACRKAFVHITEK